ncbi:MAG TPA: type IV toxin-antitoxin system AbiEi family antitoxin domain-containing protein [Nitriliruptorales bacterium]
MPGKIWEHLYDVALDRYGFVTSRDAKERGLPATYLGVMKSRGLLEHIGYGLYRFPQVPVTDRTPLMEAVLWVGKDAALSHDAVLDLHDLAFVNPRTIRVVTPHRVRRTQPPPGDITIIQDELPGEHLTSYFGIPSTTVARALVDCRGLVMDSRLREAAEAARVEGLLLASELDWVLDQRRSDR